MTEMKTWSLTSRQGSLVGVFGFVIWAVGAALDGASTLAILVIPVMLALWAWVVLLVDRWVRNGVNQPG
jgi:ABC-type phosphate transport system permease subunit